MGLGGSFRRRETSFFIGSDRIAADWVQTAEQGAPARGREGGKRDGDPANRPLILAIDT